MGIWIVTIRALRVRYRRLEVPMCVTIGAGHGGMFAEQRKICLGVIEPLHLGDARPGHGVVAGLARRGEAALVWICMASRALREGQAGVFHIGLGVLN